MSTAVIQVLTGALGSLGFCLFAHVRGRNLAAASLGGLLGWFVYLLLSCCLTTGLFLATLLAAAAVCAWCEGMARLMKAPATLFLAPGIIPLLPGSNLYYTMLALLNRQTEEFRTQGIRTVVITMGIASGVVLASIIVSCIAAAVSRLAGKQPA